MDIIVGAPYDELLELYRMAFTDPARFSLDRVLWDQLNVYHRKSEHYCLAYLKQKSGFYVMRDPWEQSEEIADNDFHCPGYSILKMTPAEFFLHLNILPEDIYLFDDSFAWSVILTHEFISHERRYCLMIE